MAVAELYRSRVEDAGIGQIRFRVYYTALKADLIISTANQDGGWNASGLAGIGSTYSRINTTMWTSNPICTNIAVDPRPDAMPGRVLHVATYEATRKWAD
tara:strand:- start:1018 stop:1317 length:300 start_codon:yes stop_codon:yes gene_type:complete